METGFIALIVVILIRALVPFTILKWPFWGAVLAILGDICDVMIFEQFGSGPLEGGYYHNFDKFFDTYYLFFEFIVVFRWQDVLARRTAKTLFTWRFLGFAIFEITALFGSPFRPAFFLSPNIFEHFYLFWAFILRYKPDFKLTPKRLVIALLVLGLPKIAQEYVMHYKHPDQTWNFLRDHLFFWLYD